MRFAPVSVSQEQPMQAPKPQPMRASKLSCPPVFVAAQTAFSMASGPQANCGFCQCSQITHKSFLNKMLYCRQLVIEIINPLFSILLRHLKIEKVSVERQNFTRILHDL
jgi:hypothetical protein